MMDSKKTERFYEIRGLDNERKLLLIRQIINLGYSVNEQQNQEGIFLNCLKENEVHKLHIMSCFLE